MKKIGISVLGYGRMGSLHSFAYKVLPVFDSVALRLVSVFGRTEGNVKRFAERYGFETYCTDWKKIIEDDKVDVVDICTPPSGHPEPAVYALERGKNVICEKPLAARLEGARRMMEVANKSSAKSMVMFNLRFMPAIERAKKLINEGLLGQVYRFVGLHPRMSHVYPKRYFSWKDILRSSGGGPLLDLGVHIADLARFLVGEVKEVSAITETYIKERPVRETGETRKVEIEDSGLAILKFECGALGILESTKVGTGHVDSLRVEVNGEGGAISWNLERPSSLFTLSLGERDVGWKEVKIRNPYPYASEIWQGHVIGISRFLKCLEEDKEPQPSFRDGLRAQEIIDAAYRSSKERRWVKCS